MNGLNLMSDEGFYKVNSDEASIVVDYGHGRLIRDSSDLKHLVYT